MRFLRIIYVMKFNSLKDKCEYYRHLTDYRLTPNTNMLIMLDGNRFSKLIKKNFNLPFDDVFIEMMNKTALYLCNHIQGAKFAYVQSDEISILVTDYDTDETETLYNGRLCKIQSIISAMATSEFNRQYILFALKKFKDDEGAYNKVVEQISNMEMCRFDCKAWTVPTDNDVYSWFLYRQYDCIRNSKQQAAQTYISHSQLKGLDTDKQIALLKEMNGVDWNEYPDTWKYGRFIYKVAKFFTRTLDNGEELEFERFKFEVYPAFYLKDQFHSFFNTINLHKTIDKTKYILND